MPEIYISLMKQTKSKQKNSLAKKFGITKEFPASVSGRIPLQYKYIVCGEKGSGRIKFNGSV